MTNSHKLAGLDALRGIAILLVIAAHFGAGLTGSKTSIVFANAGVILFFFLSGFLMYWTLSADQNCGRYAVRRFFRILPMYWVSIFFIALSGQDWDLRQILTNATFTAPIFGTERMLGVYWTLYIEVLFYFVAPFVFFLGAVRFSPYVALAGFAVFAAAHGVGSGAPFYAIFCLCGMQIAACHCGKMARSEVVASVVATSVFFALLLPLPNYFGLVPLTCTTLLMGALELKTRFIPLEFLGTVSYSWYLLHSIFGYGELQFSCLTLLLSIATYYLIEHPSINAGKAINFQLSRLIPEMGR